MANNYPIEIVRSASVTITLTLKDNDGDAINLTGAKVIFAVKTRAETISAFDSDNSTAKLLVETTSHTLPLQGKTQIVLSNAETNLTPGSYVYGVKVIPSSGPTIPSSTAPFIVKPRGVEGDGN